MRYFLIELLNNKPFFMFLAVTLGLSVVCLVDEYTKNREE